MTIEKFLFFYGWLIPLGGGAIWAAVKAWRRSARRKQLSNMVYGGRSPHENAVLLEETAGLLQNVQSMLDDPAVSTILDVAEATSSWDVIGTRQQIVDQLAKLERASVQAYRPQQLRRHTSDDQTRQQQQGA